MKKIIISLFATIALLFAGILLWCLAPSWAESTGVELQWFDMLAVLVGGLAIIPSCFMSQGIDELKSEKPC